MMNELVYNNGDFERMWIKCMWLRFLAYFLILYVGPFILIAASPLLLVLFGPYHMYNELRYGDFLCGKEIQSAALRLLLCVPLAIFYWLGCVILSPVLLPVYLIVISVFSFIIMIE